jgi:predicted O-methyltransferase YrrM
VSTRSWFRCLTNSQEESEEEKEKEAILGKEHKPHYVSEFGTSFGASALILSVHISIAFAEGNIWI